MRLSRGFSLVAMALLAALAACTSKQDPQEVKEKTAQATAQLKVDAKAVAAGIREGWSRDTPLDITAANHEPVITLPGVSGADADKVIAGRPYDTPDQLVTRPILTQREYDRIAARLTAKK